MEQGEGTLTLVTPAPAYEVEYRRFIAERRHVGERNAGALLAHAQYQFPTFLQQVANYAAGEALPHGMVPFFLFWLIEDGEYLVGESTLRPYLTPDLEQEGGHIGYCIRPCERHKGYGTRLLALTLAQARTRGLERVLLTCDAENTASARIIERNGGLLLSRYPIPNTPRSKLRYWILL